MNQIMMGAAKTSQTMTSREIADLVESRHDDVKRSIDRLVKAGAISKPPMADGEKAANGVIEMVYVIGKRDSYVIVAQLSPTFTARLVDRWQELEAIVVADPLAGLPAEHRALIAVMVENAAIKAKQAAQATQIAAQADSIKRLESKTTAIENGAAFFTVIGFGVHRGIKFGLTDAAALGRAAAKLSKAAGIAVDKVRDPRFGIVNSYHETMLDAALEKTHGGM